MGKTAIIISELSSSDEYDIPQEEYDEKTTLQTSGEDVKTPLKTSGEDVKTPLKMSGEDVDRAIANSTGGNFEKFIFIKNKAEELKTNSVFKGLSLLQLMQMAAAEWEEKCENTTVSFLSFVLVQYDCKFP